jgi:glycosyltransferase involved in cell wall biosynthesis
MNFIKELLRAKCVIVLYTIAYGGGATKSIFSYYKYNIQNSENVVLVIRDSRRGGIKLFLTFLFGKKVIINGLAAFSVWDMLFFCYFKKDALFYLHEAEHAVNYFKKVFPLKYKIVERILRHRSLICVSEWQANYYLKTFGSSDIKIIYETIEVKSQVQFPVDKINIVMVGYFSERKGVNLFSQIADIAQECYKHLQFHWVGSGPKQNLYFSPHVNWVGEISNPLEIVKECDVFLLTSIDDPFPLACLEALSVYKKCVVFRNTGTAEIIDGISGCTIYEQYKAMEVLEAIDKVLKEDVDIDKVEKINKSVSSIESFSRRMDDILIPYKL